MFRTSSTSIPLLAAFLARMGLLQGREPFHRFCSLLRPQCGPSSAEHLVAECSSAAAPRRGDRLQSPPRPIAHTRADFLVGTWLYDSSGALTRAPHSPGTLLTALCGTLRSVNGIVPQPDSPLELGIPDWTSEALVPGAAVAVAIMTPPVAPLPPFY